MPRKGNLMKSFAGAARPPMPTALRPAPSLRGMGR